MAESQFERATCRPFGGRVDATGRRQVRIIVERPNHGVRRRQAEAVLGHEALPKHLHGVPLGATARRPDEVGKQRLVFKSIKDCSQFSDDGWGLLGLRPSGSLCEGHGKSTLPCGLGAVRHANAGRPRCYLDYLYSRPRP